MSSVRFGYLVLCFVCVLLIAGAPGSPGAATLERAYGKPVAVTVPFRGEARSGAAPVVQTDLPAMRLERLLWSVDCPAIAIGRQSDCPRARWRNEAKARPAERSLPNSVSWPLAAMVLGLFWAGAFVSFEARASRRSGALPREAMRRAGG